MSCLGVSDKIHVQSKCLCHISNIYSIICMFTSAKVHYHFPFFFAFCCKKSGDQKEENKQKNSSFHQLPTLVLGVEIHQHVFPHSFVKPECGKNQTITAFLLLFFAMKNKPLEKAQNQLCFFFQMGLIIFLNHPRTPHAHKTHWVSPWSISGSKTELYICKHNTLNIGSQFGLTKNL